MMTTTTTTGSTGARRALPERGPLERPIGLELFERLRIDTRGEVLPAAVGEDRDHVPAVDLRCHAVRDRSHCAARDAGEDSLLLDQLLRPNDCVAVGDEDLSVEQ